MTIPQCVELISRKDYNQLLSYDQLNVFKKETSIIGQMEEGDIKFNPTYKYNFNANEYDTTKRTPSWCDRILYKRGSNVKVIAYNRCDFTLSDHKPIYGIYNLKTWNIDKEKKKPGYISIRYSINGGLSWITLEKKADYENIDDVSVFTYELFKVMGILEEFICNGHKAISYINSRQILAHR